METKLKQEPVADGNGRIVCKYCLKSNGEHNTEDECIDNRGHLLGTEWEPLTAEPVADGGGMLPLDVTESDLNIGNCAADTAMDLASQRQIHAYIKNAVAELECRERQLASSQEALRLAQKELAFIKGIAKGPEILADLRERMQQAVARLNKAAAEKDLVEEVLDEVVSLLSPEGSSR